MKKILLFILILIFSSAMGLFAREVGHGEGPHRFENNEHQLPLEQCFRSREYLKDTLQLSDEQINKIKKINSDHRDKIGSLLGKIRPLHRELRTVMLADDIDLTRARTLLEDISKIEIEIRMLKLKHRAEIEKILTAEQKTKFRAEKKGMCGRGN